MYISHEQGDTGITTTVTICGTRSGTGRGRNTDIAGGISPQAQVSECSVLFVNNEGVLSTFLWQKYLEQISVFVSKNHFHLFSEGCFVII